VRVLVVLLGLVLAGPAAAWDDFGHMLVAAVAYDQLTPATKARVAALLALNRYPVNGFDDAAPAERDKAQFMMAATAPDAIKNTRYGFADDGDDGRVAPDAGRNAGFSDPLMHKYWHYIDLPFSPDGTETNPAAPVNAAERIGVFRRVIASDAPDALKAFDLVWLLHLVGDIHQPLHATTRFTVDAPQGDAGGNLVRVCERGCRHNLHAFWDEVLGKSESVAIAIQAADELPAADASDVAMHSEMVWARESFELARMVAYAYPVGANLGPVTLDESYRAQALAVAERRAALAGARLARVLNLELR
jgi:hypothetical protein